MLIGKKVNNTNPSNKSDEGSQRTDEKLGEIAGVSKKTIRNTETILTKGTTMEKLNPSLGMWLQKPL